MQWWCFAQGSAWAWRWKPYPGVWILVLALLVLHLALRRRNSGGAGGVRRADGFAAGGLGALWFALDWPLGPLGAGYLASAHALQFLLIALVAAPLLLCAARDAIGMVPSATGRSRIAWLVHPLVAGVVFNVATVATHVPAVVDAAMVSAVGAFALDMTWLFSALLFWWPVLMPVPHRPGFGVPLRILYMLAGTLFHSGIAIVMLLSDYPMYRVYELAPPMGFLSAIEDQQLAGGVMELGGAALVVGYVSALFYRWTADAGRIAS